MSVVHLKFYWLALSYKPETLQCLSKKIKHSCNNINSCMEESTFNAEVDAYLRDRLS